MHLSQVMRMTPELASLSPNYPATPMGRIWSLYRFNLLTFADDIDIITQTPTALRQAFLSLEKEAHRMGLKINENKTKCMICTKSCFNNSHFKIEEYK
ncbi:UNVERIFIED_CONTAM: hypothetical protein NCL1_40616 [Trichonephila clavipes]